MGMRHWAACRGGPEPPLPVAPGDGDHRVSGTARCVAEWAPIRCAAVRSVLAASFVVFVCGDCQHTGAVWWACCARFILFGVGVVLKPTTVRSTARCTHGIGPFFDAYSLGTYDMECFQSNATQEQRGVAGASYGSDRTG